MRAHLNKQEDEHHELKRHLGALNLTAIGIGAIIGAGIFVITGQAAADYAGSGIALSFIIAAIICILAGLCYAELSSLIPISGGSYSYAYVALGEFPAWIVGWSITAQYLFSSSTVCVSWSGYCVSVLKDFGIVLPPYLTHAPIFYSPATGYQWSGSFINLPAMILAALVGILISTGIKAASNFNNVMVVIKLTTIALFIMLGIGFIHTENWTPFIPENTGIFGQYGWSGIVRGASIVFFAYIGFETVSTLAQESINPQKDLPRAILGSIGICTVAYIITALVLTGVVSYKLLNVPDPMSLALNAMGSSFVWLKFIVKFAILAGLSSVVLVQQLAQTRVFYTMSRDGLLPRRFSTIKPTTRSPFFATIVTISATLIISGLLPIAILGEIVSMMALFLFGVVCLGVLILRYTQPELKRQFKVPLVPYIPILGILGCLFQMSFLPVITWLQFISWLLIGLVIYFSYSIHQSKIRKENRDNTP